MSVYSITSFVAIIVGPINTLASYVPRHDLVKIVVVTNGTEQIDCIISSDCVAKISSKRRYSNLSVFGVKLPMSSNNIATKSRPLIFFNIICLYKLLKTL